VSVPDYIQQRLRQAAPADCRVIECSTPVISFGNPATARVATLGLNPSRREFFENGLELDGARRRFETLNSIGAVSLADASADQLEQVLDRCYAYFHGYPYRRWFDQLDTVLRPLGASYYDDTACHLDLSQWATDPTWNGLSSDARDALMTSDAPFLRQQIAHEGIALLLINGNAVTNGFARAFGLSLTEAARVSDRAVTTRISTGTLGRMRVIAWSTNLQSAFGLTRQLRAMIAETVVELAL
jgi:hypothetical protein